MTSSSPSVSGNVPDFSKLVSSFSQGQRLLRMHMAPDSPVPRDALLPHILKGSEGVCEGLDYRLDVLAQSIHLPLKSLIGLPVACAIGNVQGGEQLMCGIVTEVEQLGSDGGFAQYQLRLEDGLSILRRRITSRVFCGQSVLDITHTILDEHRQHNSVLASAFSYAVDGLRTHYERREFTMQYNESDYAFLTRLWRQEGICWHFQHRLDNDRPLHTLRLVDNGIAWHKNPLGTFRFHRADATEQTDTVNAWHGHRELRQSDVLAASYDYLTARTASASAPAAVKQGKAGDALASTLTDYHYDAPHIADNDSAYARRERRRGNAHHQRAKHYAGESVVRAFSGAAGGIFTLSGEAEINTHPAEQRQFILTHVETTVRNHLLTASPADSSLRLDDEAAYSNRFECVRADIELAPTFDAACLPVVGPISARVVGGPGMEVDVDALGRVALRFLFTQDGEHPKAGASDSVADSARVRVALPLADEGFGTAFWPRVGSDVLVMFLQNHPDKPVVVGNMHHPGKGPTRFSGLGELPNNAALMGIRSKEFKSGRYNQLRLDDTTGQISAQLMSQHQNTQLNQGWLGTPRNDGESAARGEGFELTTDAAGAVRTARGLLLSAFARFNACGKQLDRDETLRLMEECVDLFKELGDYASKYEGQATDTAPQSKLVKQFGDWENGSNTAQGSDGGAPMVAVTAPAGVHLSSPASVVTHAGLHVDTVALKHLQFASGEQTTLNAGRGLSLFSQSEGLRIIANHGDAKVQAQAADVQVEAAKNILLAAADGRLTGMAKDEILLSTAGGAYLKLSGGDVEIGGPGNFTVKAAQHVWEGPGNQAANLPKFKADKLGRKPSLVRPTDGQPLKDHPYEITRADGSVIKGKTNASGQTDPLHGEKFEHLDAQFFRPKD